MYTCPNCKKFASAGPGNCWKCGAKLVAKEEHILFVGVIDGRPELEFLRYLNRSSAVVHLTTYGEASEELLKRNGRTYGMARIVVETHVDATDLQSRYPDVRFNVMAWLGPTYDVKGKLHETPEVVGRFIASAATVAAPNGVAFVLQDMKTPNFRNILTLPGAYFCRALALPGRTQTQHKPGDTKKVMEQRVDQLFAFTFENGRVSPGNDNGPFKAVLAALMAAPMSAEAKQQMKDHNPNFKTKAELADLIFAMADNSHDGTSLYTCPRCAKYSRIGAGSCPRCGADLVLD